MKFIRSLLYTAVIFCFISCGTQQKLPNYLQNISDTAGKGDVQVPELRIQKNDILSIQVFSLSTRPDRSDVLYNLPTISTTGGATVAPPGLLVDAEGNIE